MQSGCAVFKLVVASYKVHSSWGKIRKPIAADGRQTWWWMVVGLPYLVWISNQFPLYMAGGFKSGNRGSGRFCHQPSDCFCAAWFRTARKWQYFECHDVFRRKGLDPTEATRMWWSAWKSSITINCKSTQFAVKTSMPNANTWNHGPLNRCKASRGGSSCPTPQFERTPGTLAAAVPRPPACRSRLRAGNGIQAAAGFHR